MPRKTQAFTHLEGWDLERVPDVRLKAGQPSDADFYGIPRDGFVVWDTTHGVFWTRLNGAWTPSASRPTCYAQSNAATSLPTGAYQPLALAVEGTNSDLFGMHDPAVSNDRFTVPTGFPTGYWRITGHGSVVASAAGTQRRVGIGIGSGGGAPAGPTVDMTVAFPFTPLASTSFQAVVTAYPRLAAGDTFNLQVFQDSGGALNSFNAPDWLHAEFLGAA